MTHAEANILAVAELKRFDLYDLGWRFKWDKAKRRNGSCQYRAQRITLSRHYVTHNADKPNLIKDTILHEIAHALVGPGHGHNHVWKAKCRQIGARPVRCKNVGEVTTTPGKWQATCGGCTLVFHRHKRPPQINGWFSCRKCGPVKGRLTYVNTHEIAAEGN